MNHSSSECWVAGKPLYIYIYMRSLYFGNKRQWMLAICYIYTYTWNISIEYSITNLQFVQFVTLKTNKMTRSLFQDFHEDFDKEVKLSLVDTEAVDDQRRTLEETWDTYKWASVRIEIVKRLIFITIQGNGDGHWEHHWTNARYGNLLGNVPQIPR